MLCYVDSLEFQSVSDSFRSKQEEKITSLHKDLQSKDNADVEIEKLDYCSIYFKKEWWESQALCINFELKAFFKSSNLLCMLLATLLHCCLRWFKVYACFYLLELCFLSRWSI